MTAVGLSESACVELLGELQLAEKIAIASVNSPRGVTAAGSVEDLGRLELLLAGARSFTGVSPSTTLSTARRWTRSECRWNGISRVSSRAKTTSRSFSGDWRCAVRQWTSMPDIGGAISASRFAFRVQSIR